MTQHEGRREPGVPGSLEEDIPTDVDTQGCCSPNRLSEGNVKENYIVQQKEGKGSFQIW